MAYISDSTDFSTVNASANTAIATPLPQGAVNFYYPTMVVNTWYRYYDIDSANVYEIGSFLRLLAGVGEQNGIIQKLSNLIVGSVYNIQIDFNLNVVGTVNLLIYSGTILQSTHVLSGSTSQTIQFTANSTQDTIVIDSKYISVPNLLQIDTITITTPSPTTPYLTGYSVKPATVGGTGIVTFTDGTNAVTPNQKQCEAYGYTYNKDTGTCRAFTYSTTLQNSLISEGNIIKGQDNIVMMGTGNTHIVGETNLVNGDSRNNIIVGSNNEIANGVNNAVVFGNYGLAQRPGEVVIGGGGFSGTGKGYAQSSYITLTGTTVGATTTDLYVNGDSANTIIARNGNVFTGFEANIIAVRTGGTNPSGAIDDRKFNRVTGIVFGNTVNQTTTLLESFGHLGTITTNIAFSGSDMIFQVTGNANRDISWSCTLNLYEVII